MRRIRVLIADDHALVRAGLRALLAAQPDLEVVGEADSGVIVERLCTELEPDVVLMDLAMPGRGRRRRGTGRTLRLSGGAAPVHPFHIGMWFDSPDDSSAAGCHAGHTPFNGEHNAGIQVLNTTNFPDGDGPIGQFTL